MEQGTEYELKKNAQDKSLYQIDHLIDYIPEDQIEWRQSPLMGKSVQEKKMGGNGFIPEDTFVKPVSKIQQFVGVYPDDDREERYFLKGGPRRDVFFESSKVTAAIVTCGGLCPGLNSMIRDVTKDLYNYGVRDIYGIQYGYKGFYTYNWLKLDLQTVQFIHKKGGTVLGSSRGGFDSKKIIQKMIKKNVNMVFIIGGDGTQRGALALYNKIKEQKLKISIIGLPKTIDNDIQIIDQSFGYQTSVDEAIKAINSGESEAFSGEYGIGLIKLMGRSSGHIALEASLSQRGVDILLIPEVEWELQGPNGLLEYIFKYLINKHRCVIVVAEGAGESMKDSKLESQGTDQSGNIKFGDIGLFLKSQINSYCKDKGMSVTLKYIDPTYMIRAVPSNPFDTQFCAQLAFHAVHGAMAGFTGFCVGRVNNRTCYIPLELITKGNNIVDPMRNRWQRFLANSRMPNFINNQ